MGFPGIPSGRGWQTLGFWQLLCPCFHSTTLSCLSSVPLAGDHWLLRLKYDWPSGRWSCSDHPTPNISWNGEKFGFFSDHPAGGWEITTVQPLWRSTKHMIWITVKKPSSELRNWNSFDHEDFKTFQQISSVNHGTSPTSPLDTP
jgi:hypothetical protein